MSLAKTTSLKIQQYPQERELRSPREALPSKVTKITRIGTQKKTKVTQNRYPLAAHRVPKGCPKDAHKVPIL